MKLDKICVYTCITGNYDSLSEISLDAYEKNVDYYCFTNNKNIKSKTWKVIYLEDFSLSNHMLNRKIKILGHPLINDKYDILVYMDGNVILKKKITDFVKKECEFDQYAFACFKHSVRKSVLEEANACMELKKDNKEIITKQLDFYKKNKFNDDLGLYEMRFFVRKSKDYKVIETMNLWYDMISSYSKRDQLSFPWCLFTTKLEIKKINFSSWDNDYFTVNPHYEKDEQIKKYRLYFGKSDKFNYEKVLDGCYKVNENIYKIEEIKVPNDCEQLEFFVCDGLTGIEFKNINFEYNNDYEIVIENYTEIENRKFFFNNSGKIIFKGNFMKNDILNISIWLNPTSIEEWIKLAHDCYVKSEKISFDLEKKVNNLENDKSILLSDVKELSDKIKKIENSKGWKLLEKVRLLKNNIVK